MGIYIYIWTQILDDPEYLNSCCVFKYLQVLRQFLGTRGPPLAPVWADSIINDQLNSDTRWWKHATAITIEINRYFLAHLVSFGTGRSFQSIVALLSFGPGGAQTPTGALGSTLTHITEGPRATLRGEGRTDNQ